MRWTDARYIPAMWLAESGGGSLVLCGERAAGCGLRGAGCRMRGAWTGLKLGAAAEALC